MHKLSLSLLALGLMALVVPSAQALEATAGGKSFKNPVELKEELVRRAKANLACDRYKARLCAWCPAGEPTCVSACNEAAQTYKECTDELAKRLKAIDEAMKPKNPCGLSGTPKCSGLAGEHATSTGGNVSG